MGTQQILMIVLSVIIVGVAVGVGITMFQNQARNSNRQAVISDLQNFRANAIAFYKMPASMGGGGNGNPGFVGTGTSGAQLRTYLGFPASGNFSNDNGDYSIPTLQQHTLTINGLGKEIGQDGETKINVDLVVLVDATTGAISDTLKINN